MLDFTDQVVLVTGVSSGIGAAVAQGFASRGAQVVVHYNRNRVGAEQVVDDISEAGGSASAVTADLADTAAAADLVDGVVSRHGRIDVLVNNAGDLVRRSAVAELSDEDFHRVMDVNMTSVFAMSRRTIPVMRRQGSGSIVNVTSVAARTGGGGGSVVYATAKGAVSTFTRGLPRSSRRRGSGSTPWRPASSPRPSTTGTRRTRRWTRWSGPSRWADPEGPTSASVPCCSSRRRP